MVRGSNSSNSKVGNISYRDITGRAEFDTMPKTPGLIGIITEADPDIKELLEVFGIRLPAAATGFIVEVSGSEITADQYDSEVEETGDPEEPLRLTPKSKIVKLVMPTPNGVRTFYTVTQRSGIEDYIGKNKRIVIGGLSFNNGDKEIRVITGVVDAKTYYRSRLVESEFPKFKELVEILGWFFDPIRALGLALSARGHWMLIDNPGTGKSTILRSITIGTVTGTDYSEAALVYNMRDNVPGLLVREMGGLVGWDEIGSVEDEKVGFILTVLDGEAQRFKGAPIRTKHECRFILSDNAIPEMPTKEKVIAMVSRMQWIGGVLGEYQESPQFFTEVLGRVKDQWLDKFRAVHLAEYRGDWDRREVFEILGNIGDDVRKEAKKAFAKAVQNVADRFPVLVDGADILQEVNGEGQLETISGFAKACARARSELRLLRLAEILYAFEDQVEDAVEHYFALTELDSPKGDPEEKAVRAWAVSLKNNYGQYHKEVPPMKSALKTPLSEADLMITFEELLS